MEKFYAVIRWTIEDIQAIRPDWTTEDCRAWWEAHEKAFAEILIQHGNECLQVMIDQ